MAKNTVLCVGLVMVIGVNALAHDIFVPSWRGEDGTTFQEWTFEDADNPAAPELMTNPYGSASATITLGELNSGWHQQLGGLGTQTGFWDIGGAGGNIVLDIDNRPLSLEYKEIWVQVTYYVDLSQAPVVNVPDAAYVTGDSQVVESVGSGGIWVVEQSVWRIEPNPSHEQIVITANAQAGSVIDQIVIDTICVPEPVSVALMAVGLIAIRRRRSTPCLRK